MVLMALILLQANYGMKKTATYLQISSLIENICLQWRLHSSMEVLLRRKCCVGCNTEAATPLQPLHKSGQHGGGRPLRKCLTLIYCIFITLTHGPRNRPYNYLLLPTHVFLRG